LTKTTGRLGSDAPLARLNTLGLALPESAGRSATRSASGSANASGDALHDLSGVSGAARV
jgi:hypothetical protein